MVLSADEEEDALGSALGWTPGAALQQWPRARPKPRPPSSLSASIRAGDQCSHREPHTQKEASGWEFNEL